MTQLISRGLRNAPVKNTRNMCTMIDDDEQQRRPVVDLADEQAAADVEGDVQRGPVGLGLMTTPLSGTYEPSYGDEARARHEPERQEGARSAGRMTSEYIAISPSMKDQWSGKTFLRR